jgi:Zn-finger nucleic acid-binding protein
MTAITLSCPGCGAAAAADATSCRYCDSVLTTVACPVCFAATFKGSRFCPHCGTAAAREPLERAPLPCPVCRDGLRALRLGDATLRECPGCGGLWLDAESFERICADREEQASALGAVAALALPERGPPADVVRYRPCPGCRKMMNRVNFARISGIVLDVCKTHGVWLDHGELRRVVTFISAGGLEASREKQRERLAEEQRRLRSLQQLDATRAPAAEISLTWHDCDRLDDVAAIAELIRDALGRR